MTRWAIGGVALVTMAGLVLHFGSRRTGPEVVVNAPVVPEPAPPVPARPAEPAPLAHVVDVADIDPLLDPPVIPAAAGAPTGPVLTAVGYEEPAAAPSPVGDVPPIPPAATDDAVDVAPMPREVSRRFGEEFDDGDRGPRPFVDHLRLLESLGGWPAPRVQSRWGGTAPVPQGFWRDWRPFPPDFARPTPAVVHVVGGVGTFY